MQWAGNVGDEPGPLPELGGRAMGEEMENWCNCYEWACNYKDFELEEANFCPFCGEKLKK